MSDNPGRIDWKKRLEGMKQAQAGTPPGSVVSSAAPPHPEMHGLDPVDAGPPEPSPVVCAPDKIQAGKPPEVGPTGEDSLSARQVERLGKLEQQLRRFKLTVLAALPLVVLLALGLAFLVSQGSWGPDRITAPDLTIRDAKGASRVWIGAQDGQVTMELRDQAGARRFGLGLGAAGVPWLIFYNKAQQPVTQIVPCPDGQTGFKVLNQAGDAVATIPPPNPPAPLAPEPKGTDPPPLPEPQPEILSQTVPQLGQNSAPNPGGAADAPASAQFVASRRGKGYHRPDCYWVKNVPGDNLLKFSTAAEAAKAGFYPCRRCRPDQKDD
jgi:hypothetical protein